MPNRVPPAPWNVSIRVWLGAIIATADAAAGASVDPFVAGRGGADTTATPHVGVFARGAAGGGSGGLISAGRAAAGVAARGVSARAGTGTSARATVGPGAGGAGGR